MDDQERFIEDYGLFFEQLGINRTAGRIMAWLLICDPPRQTLDEITEGLQMSKSTVSVAARSMVQFGMIERISIPGERKDYYRIRMDFWTTAFERSMMQFTGFRQLAEQGLDLLEGASEERRERLEEMRGLYSFLEREMPRLMDEWKARHDLPDAMKHLKDDD